MHCAVPFFCARSGTEGEAAWRCGERVVRSAGNASHSLRACVGAAWGSGGARGGRVAAWGSGELRRGRVAVRGGRRSSAGNGVCGRRGMHRAQPAGVRRCAGACVGAAWGSGSARRGRVAVRGREEVFGGEWVVRSAGVHRAACGRASALRGRASGLRWRAEVLGKGVSLCGGGAEVFGGEWVVRSADLTHIRRSSTRARVLLYIRPPCPRREIATMGPKDAPCEHPSPAKTSAPAPSAFTLPCPRSHFPRVAFGGPRRTIGIPQQQLSTMGYPRKSYPHRCSPPCAKRSRPRACARVYIIYRSPVARSRGMSAPLCAGWGRAKAKADAPSRSAEQCRLRAE